MGEYILLCDWWKAVFEVNMYYIGVPSEVRLRTAVEYMFERVSNIKPLHEDPLGIIHKEGQGEDCMKFRGGKRDEIVNTNAYKNPNLRTIKKG